MTTHRPRAMSPTSSDLASTEPDAHTTVPSAQTPRSTTWALPARPPVHRSSIASVADRHEGHIGERLARPDVRSVARPLAGLARIDEPGVDQVAVARLVGALLARRLVHHNPVASPGDAAGGLSGERRAYIDEPDAHHVATAWPVPARHPVQRNPVTSPGGRHG